jgi:hypothetical protein
MVDSSMFTSSFGRIVFGDNLGAGTDNIPFP